MHPFSYVAAENPEAATQTVGGDPGAVFFAGGTNLIDLMKINVVAPSELVDINRLAFASIDVAEDSISVGANVRNSELAHHPEIRRNFPVLSEALLAGASAQLRNMASTAGNLLQRTRCLYFRDVHTSCNKRQPGSGCDALTGFNRGHAILGVSDSCIATNPSDMCVALAALEAVIHTQQQDGSKRAIAIKDFYLLPGNTPDRETVLTKGELITHVVLPQSVLARRSHYLKVRDRASYEFALASAAVALEMDGDTIVQARVGLGGIATVPWRSTEAEAALTGKPATHGTFTAAAEAALVGAVPQKFNAFKIELAKRTLVLALEELVSRG
jgi:xanthine dehydrogenase YagS FAD-binding subunit